MKRTAVFAATIALLTLHSFAADITVLPDDVAAAGIEQNLNGTKFYIPLGSFTVQGMQSQASFPPITKDFYESQLKLLWQRGWVGLALRFNGSVLEVYKDASNYERANEVDIIPTQSLRNLYPETDALMQKAQQNGMGQWLATAHGVYHVERIVKNEEYVDMAEHFTKVSAIVSVVWAEPYSDADPYRAKSLQQRVRSLWKYDEFTDTWVEEAQDQGPLDGGFETNNVKQTEKNESLFGPN